MQAGKIRIGTRGSPLALAQAREVVARLTQAHKLAEGACEVVVIKTSGDRITDRPLSEEGGKGLFTKEIEEALLAGSIDLAVHSMKDMPTVLPAGLTLGAALKREDPRDAFISLKYGSLAEVPRGAVIGTSSLRRQAQMLHRRPDLKIVPFRGNVQTRLNKLAEGHCCRHFPRLRWPEPARPRRAHPRAHQHRHHAARGGAGSYRDRATLRRRRDRAPHRSPE